MKKAVFSLAVASLAITIGCVATPKNRPDAEISYKPADLSGGYAIIVKKSTNEKTEWNSVVEALKLKYEGAQVLVYSNSVSEVKEQLAMSLPRYSAIVAEPEESGRNFVLEISRMMRRLDDDPFVDSFWGIITGYEAADALRIAQRKEPLILERALDCAGTDLKAFSFARRYTEDHRGTLKEWDAATMKDLESRPCNQDNTEGVLEMLQKKNIQFMSTSGHATEHDWQMGYRGPNMAMVNRDGRLFSVNTKKETFKASSYEPKVYIGAGNCLIGHIDKRDCMATAWMHDGAAYQFVGYTVATWFGAQGWGTMGKFCDNAGLYSLAEAFHFTNTEIVEWLVAKNPEYQNFDPPIQGSYTMPLTPEMEKLQKEKGFAAIREEAGNLHDRDVVAFFGDPAWNARPVGLFDTTTRLMTSCKEPENSFDILIRVATLKNGKWNSGGIFLPLPGSFEYLKNDVEIQGASDYSLLCADNFIRVKLNGSYKSGTNITIKIKATRKVKMEPIFVKK